MLRPIKGGSRVATGCQWTTFSRSELIALWHVGLPVVAKDVNNET